MDAPSEARTRSGSHHHAEGSDSYQSNLFWPCSFPASKPLFSVCHYYIKHKERGLPCPIYLRPAVSERFSPSWGAVSPPPAGPALLTPLTQRLRLCIENPLR